MTTPKADDGVPKYPHPAVPDFAQPKNGNGNKVTSAPRSTLTVHLCTSLPSGDQPAGGSKSSQNEPKETKVHPFVYFGQMTLSIGIGCSPFEALLKRTWAMHPVCCRAPSMSRYNTSSKTKICFNNRERPRSVQRRSWRKARRSCSRRARRPR